MSNSGKGERRAEEIYEVHLDACDKLAERDDRVSVVFQAIKDIATENAGT